jgi:hypothetical protein
MFPLDADIEAPLEVARWRPLVAWILAIPHLIIANVLQSVGQALTVISFFAILFTKRIPDGIYNFQAMQIRYGWRANSYAGFMYEPYPPFEFEMTAADPGGSPAQLSLGEQGELNRWLPLVKWLLVIPHLFVLLFLLIGAFFAYVVAFFAVIFTGKWPEGVRKYVVGVSRWAYRVSAYFMLLTDEYPPFSLD